MAQASARNAKRRLRLATTLHVDRCAWAADGRAETGFAYVDLDPR